MRQWLDRRRVNGDRRLKRFEQLNPIAERIQHVHSIETIERFVTRRWKSRSLTTRYQLSKAADEQRGVSLLGGVEVAIHAEMESERSSTEPCSAAAYQVGWLLLLDESENVAIERSCARFLPRGHGELHVIKSENFAHDAIRTAGRTQE